MIIDPKNISGIGEFRKSFEKIKDEKIQVFWKTVKKDEVFGDESEKSEKAFLVIRKNTFEVRSDRKLSSFLREKYESVMESRYFGRNGIEIVNSGQLKDSEVEDLIRLSYNLTV